MRLRFLHGWGFSAGFWEKLIAEMPEMAADCDDRGYFGAEVVPESASPFIFVTHSFGTMRALAGSIAQCRGLIAVNGFDRFTPGVSPRIVERMIAKFDSDPTAVIREFRRRCDDDTWFGPPNRERLRVDLVGLREMDCTAASMDWPTSILSLQGAKDPLLPPTMREGVFAGAPRLERVIHPEGGHLLPITDAPFCASVIRAFAEEVR